MTTSYKTPDVELRVLRTDQALAYGGGLETSMGHTHTNTPSASSFRMFILLPGRDRVQPEYGGGAFLT